MSGSVAMKALVSSPRALGLPDGPSSACDLPPPMMVGPRSSLVEPLASCVCAIEFMAEILLFVSCCVDYFENELGPSEHDPVSVSERALVNTFAVHGQSRHARHVRDQELAASIHELRMTALNIVVACDHGIAIPVSADDGLRSCDVE